MDFNGNATASTILNDEYFVDLFAIIAKKSFTKDEIELLDTKGYRVHLKFVIDNEGIFRWCEFRLTKPAIDQISEKSLVKFYKSVMNTKVDTSIWDENAGKYDFIHLSYGVNPKGVDELNKWRSEQRSKK